MNESDAMDGDTPRALIVGGGLAGLAAAVRLARQNVRVTLVETRKRLGGRATSFVDPANGQVLDNCQHVLLGCCTQLIDFYQQLGVENAIAWHRRLHFVGGRARSMWQGTDNGADEWIVDELAASDLPAPLHMTQSLMTFATLTLAEKLMIARGMLAVMRLGRRGRDQSDDVSFLDWLKAHGQSDGVIEKFWAVITISALNELPQHSSLRYAMQVFQDGFLAHEDAYVMGLASVPLVELYDPAQRVLEAAGGQVLLGAGAQQFEFDATSGNVTGLRLSDGRVLHADAYISAVPFDRLDKLCDDAMRQRDARLQQLDRLTVSPIIGVHLWLDRKVMDLPHLIFMQSLLQWVFNKGAEKGQGLGAEGQGGEEGLGSRAEGLGEAQSEATAAESLGPWPSALGPCQHLHGVISAAHDLVDEPAERIVELVMAEVRKALPAARQARLIHARVVKEKRATFSVRPGADRFRPPASGAIDNLYLCGDWCDTQWPATMEGAVRSGNHAAAALLARWQRPIEAVAPDLPDAPLYRLLAR